MTNRTCSAEGCGKAGQLRRGLCQKHYRELMVADAPECSVDGCPDPAKTKGLCNKHYLRLWSKGTTDDRPAGPETCVIDDCDDPVLARGWCTKHYLRWYKHGDTGTPPRFQIKPCSVDGCGKDAESNGWCGTHYQRWRRTGTTDDPPPKPAECSVAGCMRKPRSLGMCKPHYKQLTGQGSAHEMKRYALKIGSQVEDVSYEEILAEHGMTCHLCLLPIENRADLHMDHVVPLTGGGAHVRENIRPAHKRCNQIKSDRPLDVAIALLRGEIASS